MLFATSSLCGADVAPGLVAVLFAGVVHGVVHGVVLGVWARGLALGGGVAVPAATFGGGGDGDGFGEAKLFLGGGVRSWTSAGACLLNRASFAASRWSRTLSEGEISAGEVLGAFAATLGVLGGGGCRVKAAGFAGGACSGDFPRTLCAGGALLGTVLVGAAGAGFGPVGAAGGAGGDVLALVGGGAAGNWPVSPPRLRLEASTASRAVANMF